MFYHNKEPNKEGKNGRLGLYDHSITKALLSWLA